MRPEAPVPCGIAGASAAQRIKRFNVYRNNVHASLSNALAARFPVVERLVGEDFFGAMARTYVAHRPPTSPVLAEYGAHFAEFLETFDPVADLPYLPDVARLEWARNTAYHAADSSAASLESLARIPPDALAQTRLSLHPATRWIASDYPIVSIWRTNTHDATVDRIGPEAGSEMALVTRPGLDVQVCATPPAAAPFLRALSERRPLAAALQIATHEAPFDLVSALAALFASGAVGRVEPCMNQHAHEGSLP